MSDTFGRAPRKKSYLRWRANQDTNGIVTINLRPTGIQTRNSNVRRTNKILKTPDLRTPHIRDNLIHKHVTCLCQPIVVYCPKYEQTDGQVNTVRTRLWSPVTVNIPGTSLIECELSHGWALLWADLDVTSVKLNRFFDFAMLRWSPAVAYCNMIVNYG